MFASSQYPVAGAPERTRERGAALHAGEGRECEASRRATVSLLLPDGRPGAWLLLLAGSCVYVVVQACALG
ncbi:hypothetical protein [Ramlibacter sp. AN1133]|uniref:hypothetical protein n=1 Tax=Ramlibacter sp. AN1133 TaxID=3133429 RepID=UPI0030C5379B